MYTVLYCIVLYSQSLRMNIECSDLLLLASASQVNMPEPSLVNWDITIRKLQGEVRKLRQCSCVASRAKHAIASLILYFAVFFRISYYDFLLLTLIFYFRNYMLQACILDSYLKLKLSQYPAIHTNYMVHRCTTFQYNHNI